MHHNSNIFGLVEVEPLHPFPYSHTPPQRRALTRRDTSTLRRPPGEIMLQSFGVMPKF
jgi:hypothetical protein